MLAQKQHDEERSKFDVGMSTASGSWSQETDLTKRTAASDHINLDNKNITL